MLFTLSSHQSSNDKSAGHIRQRNETLILEAATYEFASSGFKGASMGNIAQRAGLPKANVHYYFKNKIGLYIAVLTDVLELWDSTLSTFSKDDDPAERLAAYIKKKIEFSRDHSQASRIFAIEIASGAPNIIEYFGKDYQRWFKERTDVIQSWIDQEKMQPIDPHHLLFLLWSSTQHYADFSVQAAAALGKKKLAQKDYQQATNTLTQIILQGCGLTPPQKKG
ncbi:MAG: TetR/AcrR family transcriptional regulator [Pontibacterium sp.]